MIPPTKDEHDARVAITGRPYTCDPMQIRGAERIAPDMHVVTAMDEVVVEAMKGRRHA